METVTMPKPDAKTEKRIAAYAREFGVWPDDVLAEIEQIPKRRRKQLLATVE